MPDYYLDSSALLKRYKTENGSNAVRELFVATTPRQRLITSQFTILEITASAARLRKGRILDEVDYRRLTNQLILDASNRIDIVLVDADLVLESMFYAQTYALKGPDAIQLASAVRTSRASLTVEMVFVVADLQLIDAASSEGFKILNPDLT